MRGNYTYEQNGDFHGKFAGHLLGKLAGGFVFAFGKAEITITEKPYLLPEAALKSTLSVILKDSRAKFSK